MAFLALTICTILLPETSKFTYQLTKRLQLMEDFDLLNSKYATGRQYSVKQRNHKNRPTHYLRVYEQ